MADSWAFRPIRLLHTPTARRTFFDNDIHGALALKVPLIFDSQGEHVSPHLQPSHSGNTAVGVLQLHPVGSPRQESNQRAESYLSAAPLAAGRTIIASAETEQLFPKP